MQRNELLLSKPVWSSKAFKEAFPELNITLPKPNMNNMDIGLHIIKNSSYGIHSLAVEVIEYIRNGGLGTTFNPSKLETYLQDVYAKAEEDYSEYECLFMSSAFTTLTEHNLANVPSIGSKICSNHLITLFMEDIINV